MKLPPEAVIKFARALGMEQLAHVCGLPLYGGSNSSYLYHIPMALKINSARALAKRLWPETPVVHHIWEEGQGSNGPTLCNCPGCSTHTINTMLVFWGTYSPSDSFKNPPWEKIMLYETKRKRKASKP